MQNKICRGPLHPPGGELVPVEHFTTYKSGKRKGKPLSQCKYCRSSGNRRTISSEYFMPLIEVLFSDERTIEEVSKIVDLQIQVLKPIINGKRKRINKKTFLHIKRGVASIPRIKTSIGPQSKKTKRNGLSKLSFEERQGLKKLLSQAQKDRYKIEKKLLKHVV